MASPLPRVHVLMGVCGSGKTTVGLALSSAIGGSFRDADEFHPPSNVSKMASGVPLTDADRAPWLSAIARAIAETVAAASVDGAAAPPLVIGCSALKRIYRETLLREAALEASTIIRAFQAAATSPAEVLASLPPNAVRLVFLRVPAAVLEKRLAARVGHFMPPSLLASQLQTLEEPMVDEGVLRIDITEDSAPSHIVEAILKGVSGP